MDKAYLMHDKDIYFLAGCTIRRLLIPSSPLSVRHLFTGDVPASSSHQLNEFIGRSRRPYEEDKQS
jgi:hypothetical protein